MSNFKQFLVSKGLRGAKWGKTLWVSLPWGRGEYVRKKGEDSLAELGPELRQGNCRGPESILIATSFSFSTNIIWKCHWVWFSLTGRVIPYSSYWKVDCLQSFCYLPEVRVGLWVRRALDRVHAAQEKKQEGRGNREDQAIEKQLNDELGHLCHHSWMRWDFQSSVFLHPYTRAKIVPEGSQSFYQNWRLTELKEKN